MTEYLKSDSIQDQAKRMAGEMISLMDPKSSGTLDFNKFIAKYGKDIPVEMLEKQRNAFAHIDKNNDG